jgi:hypothetical protein
VSQGNASVIWRANHWAVGLRVTANHSNCRRLWPRTRKTQLGDWLKQLPDASFYTAVVTLGFYTSARVAEQVRAGILRSRNRAASCRTSGGLQSPRPAVGQFTARSACLRTEARSLGQT